MYKVVAMIIQISHYIHFSGTELYQVVATDIDAGRNADIFYSIEEITSQVPGIDVTRTFE